MGGNSYSTEIERATSFELELFEINEEWDEGSGYIFQYGSDNLFNIPKQASNCLYKKTNVLWDNEGAYISGSSRILGRQRFEKGIENIELDITDFVNEIIYSGKTNYGLGLKFTDEIESIQTLKRQSVSFHLKDTNTFYEPYLESNILDEIQDDRNYFYMDKENSLYLYSNRDDFNVSGVTIYDYNDEIYQIIPASAVTRIKTGIYKITVKVDSSVYPDAVLFKDVWNVYQNGKFKEISNSFYLINQENYYIFGLSNRIELDNYSFSFYGINSGDKIQRGDKKRIDINIKKLYKNLDDNLPLNIEYRLFVLQSGDVQVNVIPYTKVDRTMVGYEFILDTSWLIPQDYYLELKLSDGQIFVKKEPIRFTIISDDFFTNS